MNCGLFDLNLMQEVESMTKTEQFKTVGDISEDAKKMIKYLEMTDPPTMNKKRYCKKCKKEMEQYKGFKDKKWYYYCYFCEDCKLVLMISHKLKTKEKWFKNKWKEKKENYVMWDYDGKNNKKNN